MNQTNTAKDIVVLLEQENSLSSKLLSALQKEHEALSKNEFSLFTEAVTDKIELLSQIEITENQLSSVFKQNSISFDVQGIKTLAIKYPQYGTQITKIWQQLRIIAVQSQKQNHINGIMLEANQAYIRRVLNILRGQTSHAEGLYGPSGKSLNGMNSKPLAEV